MLWTRVDRESATAVGFAFGFASQLSATMPPALCRAGLAVGCLRCISGVVMALALFGAGCSGAPGVVREELADVESAVIAHNQALIRAFASMDMNHLSGSATEEQAQREFSLMAALGEGRVRMLSTLVEIEFGEVTFPAEDQASVTTTETWDYVHESLDTSETVRSEQGVVYNLRYDLVLQDGRWLVDRVTSLDEPPTSEGAAP